VNEQQVEPLGIIAGNRTLPLLMARQARQMGAQRIVAVAFENETDPELAKLVDAITWIRVGQLSKMIQGLTDQGVKRCVMVGQIAPKNLFDLRPDLRAMSLLFKIKERNAHSLFTAIGNELQKDGVELVSAVPWLEPLMPRAGFHLGPKLTDTQKTDLSFAYRIAKETSRLEIGQTVVVKEGTVLAVEAFEGTDKCLARGGELAGKSGGAVAMKVAKEDHDMRFDIPCVGPQTIQTCGETGVAVLGLETGKTLLLEQQEMERLIKKYKVAVTTFDPSK
jgi:UDP-2,3-diacylglucosamine hydrolase